jgi:hypothetical protein
MSSLRERYVAAEDRSDGAIAGDRCNGTSQWKGPVVNLRRMGGFGEQRDKSAEAVMLRRSILTR